MDIKLPPMIPRLDWDKIYNQLSTVFVSDTSIICPQRNIDIFFDGTIYGKGSSSIVKKGFIRDKPYAVKIYKPISFENDSYDIEPLHERMAELYHQSKLTKYSEYRLCPDIYFAFKYYDNTEEIHHFTMVMEPMDQTLEEYILHHTDNNELFKIILQVCNKITYLQTFFGIVHGDLKINNICVKDDEIVPIDYGMAFSFDLSNNVIANGTYYNDDIINGLFNKSHDIRLFIITFYLFAPEPVRNTLCYRYVKFIARAFIFEITKEWDRKRQFFLKQCIEEQDAEIKKTMKEEYKIYQTCAKGLKELYYNCKTTPEVHSLLYKEVYKIIPTITCQSIEYDIQFLIGENDGSMMSSERKLELRYLIFNTVPSSNMKRKRENLG